MNVCDVLKDMIMSLSPNCISGEAISSSTDLIKDLGFDSIIIVQLIINVETEFGFEFDDEMLGFEGIVNFGKLVEYVEKKCCEEG